MCNTTTFTLPCEVKTFYVISGSLAHIQRFIYDTTSKGALKNLRGRSFYLTLLTRAICDRLLRELNITHDALLYNSGGTFCIIAPYVDGVEERLADVIKEIRKSVSQMVGDDIVNICTIEAKRAELDEQCVKVFERLFKMKHRSKYNQYGGEGNHSVIFEPRSQSGNRSYDGICASLRDAEAILVSPTELLNLSGSVTCEDMGCLGSYFYFGKVNELSKVTTSGAYLLLINDAPAPQRCVLPTYREFIAGSGTKANSFEELFDGKESSHTQLAVMRMDVDNLGILLRSAMARKGTALQDYAAFSHKLDSYFKGQVDVLWKTKYAESTVIIYAGGDDLFIVGEWEQMLEFMGEIRQGFKKDFNDNASMSVSAGVVFTAVKFPIIRAAELGGDEEGRAKSFEFCGKEKNAISIFETPLRWDCEYNWVMEYKDELVGLVKGGSIERAFIQYILQLNENITFVDGKITPIKYVWQSAYDISRMAERRSKKGDNDDGVSFMKSCVADVMSGKTLRGNVVETPYHTLQLIIIAARLAEMTLWKNNDKKI